MPKKLAATAILITLWFGLLPSPIVLAYIEDSCYQKASEQRHPSTRPSGVITTDGELIEYDYSDLPKLEDLIFVCVNGKFLHSDVPTETEQGSTLIPMRALLEALGASIEWDATHRSITTKLKGKVIQLQVDHPVATIDGRPVTMPVPARMKQGRVLIPVRFVSEHLNSKVVWQPGSKIVRIFTHPKLSVCASNIVTDRTNDYFYDNSFRVATRFLLKNNGNMVLVENSAFDNNLRIQQLTSTFGRSKELIIKNELDQLGGVHLGEDGYYYVVYGQSNPEEQDSKTVYRVVKYDKTWAKVGQVDIKDVYVTGPFYHSNLTMDSYQGKLVIHSARLRYMSADGKQHQSNINFQIDMKDMKLLYSGGEWPNNHVSHSFATYARFDQEQIVYADLGDAYPRAIVLQVEQDGAIRKKINLMEFPGEIGDNYTGAHLGGLEVAKNSYLMLGSSVSHIEQYGQSNTKNLFLGIVPKDAEDDSDAKLIWLTHHSVKSNINITETHLVKVNDNKFALLWKESDKQNRWSLFYAVVDGTGKLLRQPTSLEGVPSPGNMAPLVQGDTIIWYNYMNSYQVYQQDNVEFYALHID